MKKWKMENPITSDELTKSLRHSNKGSAAGHDGWSYKLISFFMGYFQGTISFKVLMK